jgi:hypothetical protein
LHHHIKLADMKKPFILLILLISVTPCFSQSKFNREQLFLGSGLNLGFFNGFIIGLNPEVGYSFNKVIDAGVSINFNYISQNDPNFPITYRQTVYGGGPFLRAWFMDRFFIGSQYEFNTISFSEKFAGNVQNRVSYNASSLLVGGGFGSRFIGQSQFYTSIMIDVMGDRNSPYIDRFNRQLPVFRTGFTFYFKQKKAPKRPHRERGIG